MIKRALLIYLSVESGRSHRRDIFAEMFWTDQAQQPARHTLRQALTTLRRVISDHTVRAFAEICRGCAQMREQAMALYRGDFPDHFFLPDSVVFEEWAILNREQLRRYAIRALAQFTNYYEQAQNYQQSCPTARRQRELDPWREEAHRQLDARAGAAWRT